VDQFDLTLSGLLSGSAALLNYTDSVLLCIAAERGNAEERQMKNVTITLDTKTAAWARVYAARHNLSLSRFVGELLRERMHESREYEEAMRRYLSAPLTALSGRRQRYPSREALHERAGLR
jgi:hypothetical protein